MLRWIGIGPGANRWRLAMILAVLVLFLFGFFLFSIFLVEYTESTGFCSTCHVMKPEVTVYRDSPHARTDCGTCHRGPGAWALVKAEMANIRYLWIYPLNLYERPIPTPIHSLRPVEIVCEQCHWPQKFYEDRLVTLHDYAEDATNSLTRTALLLKTGGGQEDEGQGRGIHWHIENPVWYVATDEKRQEIPWVRAEFDGLVTDYLSADSDLTEADLANYEMRKMDCVDCHNRATHVFQRPADAMDDALARGLIPADLPDIKAQGVAVLERTYDTEEDAAAAIATVSTYYSSQHPDVYAGRRADVDAAVASLQAIFDQTQFPFMNVTWESHPNNIGHKDFPGCFRCHDGKHLSADDQAIRLECNICHSIPQIAGPGEPLPTINIARENEPNSHQNSNWLAQHRYQFDTTCVACHTVANPGGSDNTSFCSNGACHASEWQFVGLNAPKIRELSDPPRVPSSGTPREIPHPTTPRINCLLCHGPEGVRAAPENHADFTPDMCTTCHPAPLARDDEASEIAPAPAEAPAAEPSTPAGGIPAIPHELAGREDCLLCHNPDGGMTPAPEDHVGRSSDTCQGCHKPAAASPAEENDAPAIGEGVAPVIPHTLVGRELDCLLCHNPEDGLKPAPANHIGQTQETCQTCHKPGVAE